MKYLSALHSHTHMLSLVHNLSCSPIMGVLCGRHYQSHCHHLHTIIIEQNNCVMTRMRTISQISSPLIIKMAASGCSVSPSTRSPAVVRQEQSSGDISSQPRSMEKEFDFVERPSQDFFCPVSLELLSVRATANIVLWPSLVTRGRHQATERGEALSHV